MTKFRWVVLALLALGLAPASAAQMVDRQSVYWGAVAQYAQGDRAAALRDIGNFGEKDLDAIADAVEKLSHASNKCEDCEARHRFEALPLRAAVLLHAERDRADRAQKVKLLDGAPDCAANPQAAAAERLLASAEQQKGGDVFAANFALALAMDFRSMLCILRAGHWAEVGLKVAPGNASLFVARGLAAETMGVTGWAEPTPFTVFDDARGRSRTLDTTPRPVSRTVMRSSPIDKPRLLNVAREAFEKALAIDPDQEEARVRLGRVQWRLGRIKEAKESLSTALAGKEDSIKYLAHLFLGRCLEDSQDLRGAIDEYKAALALRPETQIGAVALAHALALRGDSEGARQVLEPVLVYSGNRRTVDPYWAYLIGTPDLSNAMLEALRSESMR
jgi:tetratricopeptide (TPR) repeat protein